MSGDFARGRVEHTQVSFTFGVAFQGAPCGSVAVAAGAAFAVPLSLSPGGAGVCELKAP